MKTVAFFQCVTHKSIRIRWARLFPVFSLPAQKKLTNAKISHIFLKFQVVTAIHSRRMKFYSIKVDERFFNCMHEVNEFVFDLKIEKKMFFYLYHKLSVVFFFDFLNWRYKYINPMSRYFLFRLFWLRQKLWKLPKYLFAIRINWRVIILLDISRLFHFLVHWVFFWLFWHLWMSLTPNSIWQYLRYTNG